jgi:hypothetical protein
MPFTLRLTETPTLSRTTELEQIIIVDKTGPSTPLGVSSGASCLVGEFLKGPFAPTEVFSQGDLQGVFTGDGTRLDRISQNGLDPTAAGFDQDGSAVTFDGNGHAELLGKQFNRLVLSRVDCDMVVADDPLANKAYLAFNVTVAAADVTAGRTNKDLLIPEGTRFATDSSLATPPTVIIALSQPLLIPAGTAVRTTNRIFISSVAVDTGAADDEIFNVSQDPATGALTLLIQGPSDTSPGFPRLAVPGSIGPTCFFVKNYTAAIGVIDSVITPGDNAIPNSASTITATGISTVDIAAVATDVWAPRSAAVATAALTNRILTRYPDAIKRTLPTDAPMIDITHIWSAKNWSAFEATVGAVTTALAGNIRSKLWENAKDASAQARGRTCGVSNPPSRFPTLAGASEAKTAVKVLQAEFTGVDADRVFVNFPYSKQFITALNRNVLVSPGGWKASLVSNLPEEFQTSVQNNLIQSIQGLEDAFVVSPLERSDYVDFKAKGVSALIKDRVVGWWFQSGITAVSATLFPTRVSDNRRRMADFIQDTIAGIAAKYSKFPGTTERVDALVGEIDAFLSSLKSVENPATQRIEDYSIDAKSLNTPALTGQGIRTFAIKVRMLGDLNYLVFETSIGPTVEVNQVA